MTYKSQRKKDEQNLKHVEKLVKQSLVNDIALLHHP